jgi:hypothetical protein
MVRFLMELTRERLRAQVRVIPRTGCWEYIGACDAFGYGRVFLAGKERKAQRVCYEAFIGPIPKGGRLRHHLQVGECIGSKCCNPAHVEVKLSFSSATIAQRMCKKGHLINAENSVIEQRGDNLLVRCRLCRREAWRNEKRFSRS